MNYIKFQSLNFVLVLLMGFSLNSSAFAQDLKHAGALAFSPQGVLFVGDNVGGAIYAYEIGKGEAPEKPVAIDVDNIDSRIASILGMGPNAISINDMAVHPVTQEVYLSVTRGHGSTAFPAIVKINMKGKIKNIHLNKLKNTKQNLKNMPDGSKQFNLRGMMEIPPSLKDITKAQQPMRTLAILDIEYYKGELFVAGISNEEFASTLRRMPYPFTGSHTSSHIKMWHIAHDQYETRAPIRTMVAKNIGGVDYLVASYTCSPIVLIPLKDLQDGASVTGRTIGDMGNGQPIDMVPFKSKMMGGKELLLVTSNSRGPQVFPLDGLDGAKVYTEATLKKGSKFDPMGVFPIGPLGYTQMFVGSSLQMDLLNEMFFVSLTRDAQTGSLDLESLPTFFPVKLHRLYSEYDFPGYQAKKE